MRVWQHGDSAHEHEQGAGSREGVCGRVSSASELRAREYGRGGVRAQIELGGHAAGLRPAGPTARFRPQGRAWRGGGGRAVVLAGAGASWRVSGRLADPLVGSSSSTYICP